MKDNIYKNIRAKKRLGQNFLIDKGVVKDIVAGAGISGSDSVLEIGPGTGVLTEALVRAAGEVTAVEVDRDLVKLLRSRFEDEPRLTVVEGDVLKTDLLELIPGEAPVKVVANLPYYITTPVIMRLLDPALPVRSITLMVQKEVAGRLMASPGTKEYGALTCAAGYRAGITLIREVGAECFSPRPHVDSAVVRLDIYDEAPIKPADPGYMFSVIRAVFSERRKTLANALRNARELNLSREEVTAALRDMGLREDIRGERLSLGEFAVLSDRLKEISDEAKP